MRKTLNLYTVASIPDFRSYDLLIRACSNYTGEGKEEEYRSIQKVAARLQEEHITMMQAEGFCISSRFTTIDTEFDLLKITADRCLNIELKSQIPAEKDGSTGPERIREQLILHRYLLAHLDQPTQLFTVVTDTMEVYTLGENDLLIPATWKMLADAIRGCTLPAVENPDALFKPSMYLVSPHNSPERFLNREYILTKDQRDKKKIIMDGIARGDRYFSITGGAGTGKSLVLYDIARELAERGESVLLLHCGSELPAGLERIGEKIENLTIKLPLYANNADVLAAYRFILIDEAQRIWKSTEDYSWQKTLDIIMEHLETEEDCSCIFSFDKEQCLSALEARRQIHRLIGDMVPQNCGIQLKGNIRVNAALEGFITALTTNINRFSAADAREIAEHVSITYAEDIENGAEQIKYYIMRGYSYIYYTPYHSWKPLEFTSIDLAVTENTPNNAPRQVTRNFSFRHPMLKNASLVNTVHSAIGQEFDDVVMYLDRNFHIREDGYFYADQPLDYEYNLLKMLYQGLTRARQNIALVVVENPELYARLTQMLCPTKAALTACKVQ
ncbi:MAG TPA: hypothetical protein DDX71_07600 [Ruminococcus sp.]|nr:hypothetical protein [Ruminococcus sp.]